MLPACRPSRVRRQPLHRAVVVPLLAALAVAGTAACSGQGEEAEPSISVGTDTAYVTQRWPQLGEPREVSHASRNVGDDAIPAPDDFIDVVVVVEPEVADSLREMDTAATPLPTALPAWVQAELPAGETWLSSPAVTTLLQEKGQLEGQLKVFVGRDSDVVLLQTFTA